jgi:hypothetical protein
MLLRGCDQFRVNPLSGFPGLNFAFASAGSGARGLRFGPNQRPGAIFASELAHRVICAVVVGQPRVEIVSVAYIKASCGVLQNVNME